MTQSNGMVLLRRYRAADAGPTADVFQTAIRTTGARWYDAEQVDAWAGTTIDLDRWDGRRRAAWTVIADLDGRVVGFADLLVDANDPRSGVLDMLFVHPDTTGRGIARLLVDAVLAEAHGRGLRRVTTRASRAARPVFARLGFVVDAENPHNTIHGVVVPNTTMHVDLGVPAPGTSPGAGGGVVRPLGAEGT